MMRLKDNKELSSIFSSSLSLVFIRVGGLVSGFLLMLLLARTMSAEELGRVITGISIVMLLSVFSTLNYDAGGLRYLSAYLAKGKSSLVASYIKYGDTLTWIAGGSIVTIAVAYWAIAKYASVPVLPNYILYAFISVLIFGRMRLFSGYMHASGKVVIAQLPRSFIRQLLFLLATGALVLAGIELNADLVMQMFFLTLCVVAIFQIYLFRPYLKALTNETVVESDKKRDWRLIGFYTLTPVLFLEFSVDVIILISALVLSKADVAVLAVVLRIAGFLQFGVTAVNMAVGPKIAAAIHNDERHTVDHLLRISGALKLVLVVIGMIFFYFFGGHILSVFGDEYSQGSGSLLLFACIPLVISLFGPGVLFVTVLDMQKYLNPVFISSLVVLFILITFLGSRLGIQGIAFAVLIVWTIWNLTLYYLTKQKHGYDISVANLLTAQKH
ncbi:MAG: MATE family efflux transporter [Methylococcaceae bacterium]